jgi:hypothetical protein
MVCKTQGVLGVGNPKHRVHEYCFDTSMDMEIVPKHTDLIRDKYLRDRYLYSREVPINGSQF